MSLEIEVAKSRQEFDDALDPIIYELTKGDWYHQEVLDEILKAADQYARDVALLCIMEVKEDVDG